MIIKTPGLITHQLKQFNQNNQTLSAEAGAFQKVDGLIKDTVYLGFKILLPSSRAIPFVLKNIDQDNEGNVRAWEYHLLNQSDTDQLIREVIIFND